MTIDQNTNKLMSNEINLTPINSNINSTSINQDTDTDTIPESIFTDVFGHSSSFLPTFQFHEQDVSNRNRNIDSPHENNQYSSQIIVGDSLDHVNPSDASEPLIPSSLDSSSELRGNRNLSRTRPRDISETSMDQGRSFSSRFSSFSTNLYSSLCSRAPHISLLEDSSSDWTSSFRRLFSTQRREDDEPEVDRILNLPLDFEEQQKFPPNIIRNQKYSTLTFVPQVLYDQFKYFFNLYFLMVCLSQFIPAIKVGLIFASLAPLTFVLCITMIKEGYDDYQRYLQDTMANCQEYFKIGPQGSYERTTSADIKVGDIILIEANQRIPADILILKTSDPSGSCFIRTDQLDGETDWKLRYSLSISQKLEFDPKLFHNVINNVKVNAGIPCKHIYQFLGLWCSRTLMSQSATPIDIGTPNDSDSDSGLVSGLNESLPRFNLNEASDSEDSDSTTTTKAASGIQKSITETAYNGEEHLSLLNTCWAETVLTSGQVLGLVIFTGIDTRSARNNDCPNSIKTGKLDLELNSIAKVLFTMTIILSFSMIMGRPFDSSTFRNFFKFIFLFSCIIPISLRVNLDMAKATFSYWMEKDPDIPGTIVQNSSIPEELGRINVVFTDKTGTLTTNQMNFHVLHVGVASFTAEQTSEIQSLISNHFSSVYEHQTRKSRANSSASDSAGLNLKNLGNSNSLFLQEQGSPPRPLSLSLDPGTPTIARSRSATGTNVNYSWSASPRSNLLQKPVASLIQAMALCHNVKLDTDGELQAASPDEFALVSFAADIGVRMVERTNSSVTLSLPINANTTTTGINPSPSSKSGEIHHRWEIIATFPFSSTTKRMGIVISNSESHIFIAKGADSAIMPMCTSSTNQVTKRAVKEDDLDDTESSHHDWLYEQVDSFARKGLRTLVFCQRYLSHPELLEFKAAWQSAYLSLVDRSEKLLAVQTWLEHDMELLGLTGVEDRLGPRIPETIESMKHAGIKVWMLTGDKVETALQISRSSGLIGHRQPVHRVVVDSTQIHESGHKGALESTLTRLADAMGVPSTSTEGIFGGGHSDVETHSSQSLPTRTGRSRTAGGSRNNRTSGRMSISRPDQQFQLFNMFSRLISGSESTFATELADSFTSNNNNQDNVNLNLNNERNRPAILIDGSTLGILSVYPDYWDSFFKIAITAPAVICCRSSPSQKALLVTTTRKLFPKLSLLAIGDGGNDVPMIRAAHFGVGIQGKEGLQASLASDVSVTQFSCLEKLLLWHGRNSYLRAAKLGQFVIHRGLLIACVQAMYSILNGFVAQTVFNPWLNVGYTTIYTAMALFALISDVDVPWKLASRFPELYHDSQSGSALTMTTFLSAVLKAIYSGFTLYLVSWALFGQSTTKESLSTIAFSALILTELLMIAIEVHTWNLFIMISQICALIIYIISMITLPSVFNPDFVWNFLFWVKVLFITMVGSFPILLGRWYRDKFHPPRYKKLQMTIH